MRQGGIQHLRDKDWRGMAEQISQILYRIVFAGPVSEAEELDPDTARVVKVENAQPPALEKALRSGRVQYVGGVFSGDFNAAISVEIRRLGGRFDSRMKVYFIKENLVPAWVKAAATGYRAKAKAVHEQILRVLDRTSEQLKEIVSRTRVDAESLVQTIHDGFKQSVGDRLAVYPTLSKESKKHLAKEYADNMELYIHGFSDSSIQALRDIVQENAEKGYRADRLVQGIRDRYGVARAKAEFLARQETSLFMSKYRELRFKEGGIRQYVWHTANDERVRSSHKALDGRTFDYDHPPVVDPPTGRRGNPGTDFNCRCVDAPVLETRELAA